MGFPAVTIIQALFVSFTHVVQSGYNQLQTIAKLAIVTANFIKFYRPQMTQNECLSNIT